MNKEDQQTAIPLLLYDNEQRSKFIWLIPSLEFVVNEEIQNFLADLKGPIGVITVAGMYRTGKSYLLNRMLLNRSSGFGVGPTINPCTKVSFKASNPIRECGSGQNPSKASPPTESPLTSLWLIPRVLAPLMKTPITMWESFPLQFCSARK